MSLLEARDVALNSLVSRHGDHENECGGGNEYDGRQGVRISAIFAIMIGSAFGALFPVMTRPGSKVHKWIAIPPWFFFICKYFGTGVIIATAFIHLLAEAQEKLGSECLTGPITEYPWTFGISLMTIIVLFFVEFLTMRYATFGSHHDDYTHNPDLEKVSSTPENSAVAASRPTEHYAHAGEHIAVTDPSTKTPKCEADRPSDVSNVDVALGESYSAILTGIFVLEFGILFHSVFIGLTLAVTSSDEFTVLYIVLVFHQLFEGLGLGARLADVPWPKGKQWTAYVLAGGFAITTPIAIAIGIGVRESYPPNSNRTLMVEGIFNSISGGILLYTGLVELLAHEFIFSPHMKKAPLTEILSAFFLIAAGTALMALLGKWA
ncbi:hypothetical protein KEM56_006486 [Ascosphaera pollenicola]|nr:hypothetical protein KEM56_006486 [Ascosphaera pollenicola]